MRFDTSHLRMRRAARALILDDDLNALLVCFETPDRRVWATPGGGIEREETTVEGLRRELVEEIGRDDLEIGPHIFDRIAVFPVADQYDGQHNRVHLIRTQRFDPQPAIGWDSMRAEGVSAMRWWSADDMRAAADDATGSDRFVPAELPDVIEQIEADGAPVEPWEFHATAFDRPPLAAVLKLEPHPEGGWFRETYRSPTKVTLNDGRVRSATTVIYFFLPAGETSAWHRVSSDELWLVHHGSVVLELGGTGASPEAGRVLTLGHEHPPQGLVPAGTWQRTLVSEDDALVSCVVSPGFEFDDFELAPSPS